MAGTGVPTDPGRAFAGARPWAGIIVAAATMLAAAVTFATGETSLPRMSVTRSDSPAASFSERFSFRATAPDCAARSWPYFAAECLRMTDGSRAQAVRIIAVDQQLSDNPFHSDK